MSSVGTIAMSFSCCAGTTANRGDPHFLSTQSRPTANWEADGQAERAGRFVKFHKFNLKELL
jgi:hypothetical protein